MPTSIESKLSLALAVKLQVLFESADRKDKFLTFPRGVGFTYQYLASVERPLGESGTSANEQQNNKCDFARLMNLSFSDSVQYSPDTSVFLWQQFEDILKNSIFPQTTLTEQEEKQLAEATQFLTMQKTDETGVALTVPSAAYTDYIRYKTVYDKANSAYLDEKLSAENATGTEGEQRRKDWSEFREKQLKDAITTAENEWVTFGRKLQVENYLRLKNALEQKKYVELVRAAYKNDLEYADLPDLAANGIPVKATFFSPNDVTDQSIPWLPLTLTKGEIDHFAQQAPPELKAMFNSGEGSDDIESVSLEYNTIAITRPWLKPEYFSSRYWKLPEGSVVSNGNIPAHGLIPAYISSMIVARNIAIKRKKTTGGKPASQPVIPILGTIAVTNTAAVALSRPKMAGRVQPVSGLVRENLVASTRLRAMAPAVSAARLRAEPMAPVEDVPIRRPLPTKTVRDFRIFETTIATPIFIPPPPRPQAAGTIDLVQLAGDPQSRWASGQLVDAHNTTANNNLPWMGGDGDSRGFVCSGQNVMMEDGQAWPTVLRTHPMWVDRGTIKGWLAWRPIPAGAHFQAKVGFLRGATGTDGVTYWVWVHYMAGSVEHWTPVAQHFKRYTQTLDTIDVDLSAYAGQSISIELRVDAEASSGQDWAAWVNPVITTPTLPPPAVEMITEKYDFDGVFVLAYACKRLPKSPDPDPTLKWS